MTLQEAIEIRKSKRKYLGTPIAADKLVKINELIKEFNQLGDFRFELVTNSGQPFNGLLKSYGMFSGVNNYLGLIAVEKDKLAEEMLGYYGELLVLHLTTMNLDTCWVSGSYSKKDLPFKLNRNEVVVCTITLGNAIETESGKENFIRKVTHRKTKKLKDMYVSDDEIPQWFIDGMTAVQKAPSAANKQPVKFIYEDNQVYAIMENFNLMGKGLDFGIAKLHFELGAKNGTWEWGNGGEFVRE